MPNGINAPQESNYKNEVVVSLSGVEKGRKDKQITLEIDPEAGPYVTLWGFTDDKSQYELTKAPEISPHKEQRFSHDEIINQLEQRGVSELAISALQFVPDYLIDEALHYLDTIKNFPFKTEDITFVGHSRGASALLVAALIEPRIKKLAILSPTHSNPKSKNEKESLTDEDVSLDQKIRQEHGHWSAETMTEKQLEKPELKPTLRFVQYVLRNIPETLKTLQALNNFEFEGALEMLAWLSRESKKSPNQDPGKDYTNREILLGFPEYDENFDYTNSKDTLKHLIALKKEEDLRIRVHVLRGTHAGPKNLKQARVVAAARQVNQNYNANSLK
ncbi:hypothetical protein GW755_00995 [bacterium]|nr:hypothetical protein [bacterium]